MEKYMIGDIFGNMWDEETNQFFTNKGTIFNSKKIIEEKLSEMKESKEYYDWQLNIWTIKINP